MSTTPATMAMSRPRPLLAYWPPPKAITVLGAATTNSRLPRSSVIPAATVTPARARLSRCLPRDVLLATTSFATRGRASNPPAKLSHPQPEKPSDCAEKVLIGLEAIQNFNVHQGRQRATTSSTAAITKRALPARSAVTTYSDAHRRRLRRCPVRIMPPARSTGSSVRPCRSRPTRWRRRRACRALARLP